MLDWLKTILGDAYTEDIDNKVSAEIGKGFVARADFNEVSTAKKKLEEDIKARDKQLEDLSKSQGATDGLKAEITKLQEQNKTDKANYDAEVAKIRMENAVDKALTMAGAKNVTAVKALLVEFLKDAKMADDGTVKGLTAEIENLVKGETTSFLFETKTDGQQTFTGMQPGNPGGNPPPDTGSYETRLAEARKSGNTAAAVAIKREAAENGVYLM
ncbi:MAG: phage scaffolding protein [Oscillospiraceae bacterium]|nr:phage scaffolding protein [Oscillospiraceae bacterium]